LLSFEAILTTGLTVVIYTVILVAIYRVFQIGADVSEMKQLLKDIRRNTSRDNQAVAVTPAPESAEALVRAVHAASYEDLDETIREAQS